MIVGIGNDLLSMKRMEHLISRHHELSRLFTSDELQEAGGDATTLAGDFAIKEAVSKVFGTGFFGIEPYEIEVLRNRKGAPYVNLYGGAKQQAEKLKITKIHVSISNTKDYVTGFAIGESR